MKEVQETLDADLPQDLKVAFDVQAVIIQKNVLKVATEKHHAGRAVGQP